MKRTVAIVLAVLSVGGERTFGHEFEDQGYRTAGEKSSDRRFDQGLTREQPT